eukprot:CAMPEP_0114488700 /NCGR_PEP_ID=MMETSP0109-20121206/1473_1 /TAXON_ID=29199 /ORGANISM="Chlorarachnion reptans, Strain CCCM449" /LENGTH=229 /DNA_ID=CAMNT_0001665117 /DNA_START=79 /DNA_END=770 /DNA_ORIENTATION=-
MATIDELKQDGKEDAGIERLTETHPFSRAFTPRAFFCDQQLRPKTELHPQGRPVSIESDPALHLKEKRENDGFKARLVPGIAPPPMAAGAPLPRRHVHRPRRARLGGKWSAQSSSRIIIDDGSISLTHFMIEEVMKTRTAGQEDMIRLISSISVACKQIASMVPVAGDGQTGLAEGGGSVNVQGEEQNKLDVVSNNVLKPLCELFGQAKSHSYDLEPLHKTEAWIPRCR